MSDQHPTSERLNAFLLDELDAAEREALAAHLRGCDACRAATAALDRVLAAYRTGEPGAADEIALGRLLDAARPPRAASPRPRWTTAALAAAAATVIFLGGFWAGQREAGDGAERVMPVDTTAPADAPAPPDREPPTVRFAAADADLLGGLAPRDTTWH